MSEPSKASTRIPFPSAPWQMRGEAWLGLFIADSDVPTPPPWKPVPSARTAGVALIRYQEGTLQYDELIVGPFVRHGLHMALHVNHIWVDDEASMQGGRYIWGLPKQLARFRWDKQRVTVEDDAGPIATLSFGRAWVRAPAPFIPVMGLGRFPGEWALMMARARGVVGRGALRVEAWSDRFPFRLQGSALGSMHLGSLSFTFPEPRRIPDAALVPSVAPHD